MRKFIKLEKISTNCKRIQKKWNKKWLTRGIFTCVVAIALIGSCRYIQKLSRFRVMSMGKNFRFTVSRPTKRRLRSHLMRHGGMMIPRESWIF